MDTKTLCLGALSMGDQTGYDIKKTFENSFGFFLDVSPSGIYRALSELEQEGAITVEHVVQQGRPNKKIFELTEAGREQLVAAILKSQARHRVHSEFLFALLLADLLPPDHVNRILDDHAAEMQGLIPSTEKWLEEEGQGAPAGMQFVARFALDMLKQHLAALKRHRPVLSEARGNSAADAEDTTDMSGPSAAPGRGKAEANV